MVETISETSPLLPARMLRHCFLPLFQEVVEMPSRPGQCGV
jgi:hypothetical protein